MNNNLTNRLFGNELKNGLKSKREFIRKSNFINKVKSLMTPKCLWILILFVVALIYLIPGFIWICKVYKSDSPKEVTAYDVFCKDPIGFNLKEKCNNV